MSFLKRITDKAMPVWQQCLETDFVRGIGDGSLSMEDFMFYIVQDSIYLRNYARVLAMGIVKAPDLSQVKTFYSLLSFVNEGEGSTRLKYLEAAGISEKQADSSPPHRDNTAYTDFMMDCAVKGDAAEILYSALPCMFSSYWIFTQLISQYPDSMNDVYGPFLADYTDDYYLKVCHRWADYAEQLVSDYTQEKLDRLENIYIRSSEYELAFWKMKKQDIG